MPNWFALAIEAVSRLPVEKLIFRPPDRSKHLEELKKILKVKETAGTGSKYSVPVEVGRVHLEPNSNVASTITTKETVDYQNREIGKELLAMETHCVQGFKINGRFCDCGAHKHLLKIEALVEEAMAMVDNTEIYERILDWEHHLGPKCTVEIAQSGKYAKEYAGFGAEARTLRKELLGTVVKPTKEIGEVAETAEKLTETLTKPILNKTVCGDKLLSMTSWISGMTEEECRECELPVCMNWYYTELEEQGRKDLAEKLDVIRQTGVPLEVCKFLDLIKDQVTPELRERLLEFDCATQSFETDKEPSD